MHTHTAKKSYKCDVCNSLFSQSSNLKRHMFIHTREKTFKCTQCNSLFAQSSYLKHHMHTHTGEKPYKCNFCYSSFSRSSNLKRHMCVCVCAHTGENWSREEKKIIYLCFQIARNKQWGRGKMKEIFMEQLRRSQLNK